MVQIRAITPTDYGSILALNAQFETETSPLNQAALAELLRHSAYSVCAMRAGVLDGFLIAVAAGSSYASPNYRWFAARYRDFLYIDRIIVAPHARGRGLARALYDGLFAASCAQGAPIVACEVNIEPPNPASDAFHKQMGFNGIGEATLAPGKRVRYMLRQM